MGLNNPGAFNSQIIAIDGPAGAGKSTVAKGLAKRLGYFFLDTGAMYRALTLKAIRNNLNLDDESALASLAKSTKIELRNDQGTYAVFLDGEDVSRDIRAVEVTNQTHFIARAPKVREIMVDWQREIAGSRNVVIEGRDTTTVVFPHAQFKFFLDASVDERVRRRLKELRESGKDVDEASLRRDIEDRDHRDRSRDVGALKVADDACVIDTSGMSVDDVVEVLNEKINHG